MSNLIEVLHSVSNKLTDVTEEQQIYQIMNDGIKQILPDSYFIIAKLQPEDMNFRMIQSFGFDEYFTAIKTLLGKDPFQIDFPFSNLSETHLKGFESRKLYHSPDGIYETVNGKFNKTICKTIEKILGISEVYALSFCVGEKYFGGAIFFIQEVSVESGILNKECIQTIESLAALASFSINKLRDFEALTKKENELAIAQSKFNQLVNQLSDIVWIAKGDGTEIIDLNNSFEKYFGYPSTKFVKNPNLWLDIVHPEDKEIAIKSDKELSISGNSECEYRIIRCDGTILWLHERKSIVYDSKGNPVQMGGVAFDITEKKLLEEQLRLKDYALENSPNAVAFTDLHGYITYINNGYLKLFGYGDRTEILGKHISEFSSTDGSIELALDRLNKGEIYIEEGKPKRKDGTIFHSIIIASSVIQKQKTLCIMAVFVDISELKELEANLKKSEAELLKQNNEKDKFFAIIAHDLRSPFNGLLGLLEILCNDYNDFSDEQRIEMVKASLSSAEKLFLLLSDLLEWARLQNNHIEINKEMVNLDVIVKDNIKLYLNDAQLKEISIKNNIELNTILNIDLNSINTVIRNLLINAIKFTQSSGCITFGLNQTNDGIEISIKDTGVGMSEDTIDKLFKLDKNITMPGTNNEKGTGLGLLICNEIVIKNNWKMCVESQLGNGSTFWILIPQNELQ
jgi:PAS domain S-box-containing protein